MGIPYSKQINAAFDQVTPLVASGYEILQLIRDIAIGITVIQVIMVTILALNLLALVGLLFTMNPDLEKERKALVTPTMKWIASWALTSSGYRKLIMGAFIGSLAIMGFAFLFYVYYARRAAEDLIETEPNSPVEVRDPMEGKDSDSGKESDSKK